MVFNPYTLLPVLDSRPWVADEACLGIVSDEAMTPSYAAGPDIPLLDRTIGQQLQEVAARIPDGLALVSRHQGIRLSWRELLDAADRVAGGMAALGLLPQDRVGVWATNCAEWIVLVNVNPACWSANMDQRIDPIVCVCVLNPSKRQPMKPTIGNAATS